MIQSHHLQSMKNLFVQTQLKFNIAAIKFYNQIKVNNATMVILQMVMVAIILAKLKFNLFAVMAKSINLKKFVMMVMIIILMIVVIIVLLLIAVMVFWTKKKLVTMAIMIMAIVAITLAKLKFNLFAVMAKLINLKKFVMMEI